ncbi:lasso peptide biosynthesis B2 protein [Sphingobium sp. TKS]
MAIHPQIYFTRTGGRTILLDVAGNRYFSLPHTAEQAFSRLCEEGFLSPVDEAALRSLSRLGIDLHSPRSTLCQPSPQPARTTLGEAAQLRPSGLSIAVALVLQLAARIALKQFGIRAVPLTLRWVRRDEAYLSNDGARTALLIAAHRKAALFAGRHDRCVEKSLAAAWHLGIARIRCTVVVGVRSTPFLAHCWLQRDHCVLNDELDKVTTFTPILGV